MYTAFLQERKGSFRKERVKWVRYLQFGLSTSKMTHYMYMPHQWNRACWLDFYHFISMTWYDVMTPPILESDKCLAISSMVAAFVLDTGTQVEQCIIAEWCPASHPWVFPVPSPLLSIHSSCSLQWYCSLPQARCWTILIFMMFVHANSSSLSRSSEWHPFPCINWTTQFGVTHKLPEGALNPTIICH